ncbi:MAG: aminotransferase class V-fold PLP-dependent enzyme [candidate division KSB1 bacterium]|nr:aminotransferase class V-fold PLP-dependent enzyme [candidate division KSB1 bacterium]
MDKFVPESSTHQNTADQLRSESLSPALLQLEQSIYTALQTYSNVHRGSGQHSMLTTHLYEQAREVILNELGLDKRQYTVIFSSPRRAVLLKKQLGAAVQHTLSSRDHGLSLGVRALAVRKSALPKGPPVESGGGTAKLMSRDWVIWAEAPDKYEAGTPAIINVIAFAKALLLKRQFGNDAFQRSENRSADVKEILYRDELAGYTQRELLRKLGDTLIGRDSRVPTLNGDQPFINLDNSASTPTFEPIWDAFCRFWRQPPDIQQKIIQEVKSICAGFLNAPPAEYDIIFTSNTTEAVNTVAENLTPDKTNESEPVIVNTLLEHSSNELPWRALPGHTLLRLSVDKTGFMDLGELENLLKAYNRDGVHGCKRIRLVAVNGASNVLGTCNDLAEISRIVHQYGAQLLVDAAQLTAHRQINMSAVNIDYLVFSAHKVYAPFGCGVLAVQKGLLKFSSEQFELIKASGEENIGGIAALGKALNLLQRIGMPVIQEEERSLTRYAYRELSKLAGIKLYGITNPDSPEFAHKIGVIVFDVKGKIPNQAAKQLAIRGGIGVRYGCHCAHILVKHMVGVPPFFEGLQRVIQLLFPKLRLPGVVRVSLGLENTHRDVDALIQGLKEMTDDSIKRNAMPKSIISKVQKQIDRYVQESVESIFFRGCKKEQ